MNLRKKPRPIEFMMLGYEVHAMQEILDRWDSLTDYQIIELGFDPEKYRETP